MRYVKIAKNGLQNHACQCGEDLLLNKKFLFNRRLHNPETIWHKGCVSSGTGI